MEGLNNRYLARIKETGYKTIIPISYVYKKNANGKFQQATTEHEKLNVDMYMQISGKEFVPISILRFRARKSQLLRLRNLSPSAKRMQIARRLSITPRPATRRTKPVKKGMQRNTHEARVAKAYCRQVNRCIVISDDNVMPCNLGTEKINETVQLNDIADVSSIDDNIPISTINSQQLQQTTDATVNCLDDEDNGLHRLNDNAIPSRNLSPSLNLTICIF
ncbi:hypothetical protein PV327_010062 [Microctonus hyperodae]|uniref:Uncharacterized protein n=1 Tax=Microctonus hyperodae TaxID=165561 RepID=A0AA39KGP2_MICHY|nr:hypothetical protein PV327_010062 [Microctonus hyperodae]